MTILAYKIRDKATGEYKSKGKHSFGPIGDIYGTLGITTVAFKHCKRCLRISGHWRELEIVEFKMEEVRVLP
jgi:hypothetical protein